MRVSTENYEREQVTFRTGVSGEMLRRAMEDAHPTPRTRVTSGTVLSGSSSRSVQPQLWDQDSFGQTPKEQNRHARDGEHPTSANSGRAVAVDEAAYGSDVIRVTPWHQTLIERFFTAPQPKDPLKSNGRLYFVLGCFLLAFGLVVVRLFKVQVVDHNQFSQAAANQYKMQVPIPAMVRYSRPMHSFSNLRSILNPFRTGNILRSSLPTHSINPFSTTSRS